MIPGAGGRGGSRDLAGRMVLGARKGGRGGPVGFEVWVWKRSLRGWLVGLLVAGVAVICFCFLGGRKYACRVGPRPAWVGDARYGERVLLCSQFCSALHCQIIKKEKRKKKRGVLW